MNECKAGIVFLMRLDYKDLPLLEAVAIRAKFPDREIEFIRVDPQDYLIHMQLCRAFQPLFVRLPRERQIPSLAMEEGYPHGIVTPQGEVLKLKDLPPPVFEPFEP